MKVNSISTYRPSKANNTSNAMPQAYASPAFGSEKPSFPRQSISSMFRTLLLGGALFSTACSSGSNGAKPIMDAGIADAAVPAAIDTAPVAPTIDAVANCGAYPITNKAAVALLDELKDSGLVSQEVNELPCEKRYEIFDRGGRLIFDDVLVPVSPDSDNLTYKGTMSCTGTGDECMLMNAKPFTDRYTVQADGTFTRELQADGKTIFKTQMMPKNGLFELVTSGGAKVGDKGETMGYRKAVAGGVELCSSEICFPVIFEINGNPVVTRFKKGFNRLAGQLGEVQHDLRLGELSLPTGKGTIALIENLAEEGLKKI